MQYQFDYESVIQDDSKAEQRIRFLTDFMKICFKKMLKALDPQFKQKNGVQLQTHYITQEEIDSYILNLVFEILFRKLQELNLEKIKDYYWHLSPQAKKEDHRKPDQDILQIILYR